MIVKAAPLFAQKFPSPPSKVEQSEPQVTLDSDRVALSRQAKPQLQTPSLSKALGAFALLGIAATTAACVPQTGAGVESGQLDVGGSHVRSDGTTELLDLGNGTSVRSNGSVEIDIGAGMTLNSDGTIYHDLGNGMLLGSDGSVIFNF